ncbi:MAG: phosphatase [Candidatus Parcubacteria bacterium]|nr:phosphatase [Candidatus Parcubacteria bacterium]
MTDKIFILDVDGVLTPGNFIYNSREGKVFKEFGSDDWDALKEIMLFVPTIFITADKKGYPITQKRIVDEMKWELHLVSQLPQERWTWMKNKFPNKQIIFFGDGIYDFCALENSFFGITTKDALDHVKDCANYVTTRSGGDRAVAEACLHVMGCFNLDWKAKYV